METKVPFSEVQRFKQPWLWLLILAINGFFIFAFVKQQILGQPFGDKPMSNLSLSITIAVLALLTILFLSSRLETRITKEGVYVRFYPIHISFKFFPWNQIKKADVRKYSPLSEYGGWGIRGLSKNKAFNTSGNKGLQLEFHDGKRLLIGTNKPEEVTTALQQLRP